jgi:hypothetical protein
MSNLIKNEEGYIVRELKKDTLTDEEQKELLDFIDNYDKIKDIKKQEVTNAN